MFYISCSNMAIRQITRMTASADPSQATNQSVPDHWRCDRDSFKVLCLCRQDDATIEVSTIHLCASRPVSDCCMPSGIGLQLASSRDCRLHQHKPMLKHATCWWRALLLWGMHNSIIASAHSMHRRVAPVPNALDPLYKHSCVVSTSSCSHPTVTSFLHL